ncbi:subtilisin-like protease SBT6.1, partial [Herrania umbratica]|uniref:Subtilisin-like protease SBT6.1 n=1 Tax=Herrania umbratica TaxID=108875 RepID=A0A6J0ZQV5_9ROSI
MITIQSSFPLKSSLFILLLSLSLLHFKLSSDPTVNQSLTLTPNRTQPQPQTTRNNYIIRFTDYKPASDHRSYLESSLRSDGWEWIERRNPASKFPTDFGLVSIKDSVKEALIGKIERLGLVKDVNVDLSYNRGMLGAAFENGKKRPGKIFTSMSFSEEKNCHDSCLSNSSINWSRHLLMQRSQVTSLFGADALWGKGYTGAKVKMAIFDTG